jgi:hypothetical protein
MTFIQTAPEIIGLVLFFALYYLLMTVVSQVRETQLFSPEDSEESTVNSTYMIDSDEELIKLCYRQGYLTDEEFEEKLGSAMEEPTYDSFEKN